MANGDFPESPVTAWTNVKSSKGFTWSYTMRGAENKDIIKKMQSFEDFCAKVGWSPVEPHAQRGPGRPPAPITYVPDEKCPLDGGRLIVKVSAEGKKRWVCENQKYDFTTKTVSGCKYVDWNAGASTMPVDAYGDPDKMPLEPFS